MYYLRKENYDNSGEDIAIYKHHDFSRFYRGEFLGVNVMYQGMKLYTCKKLKTILNLRQSTYDYCGVWFDVYDDENGKVELPVEEGE